MDININIQKYFCIALMDELLKFMNTYLIYVVRLFFDSFHFYDIFKCVKVFEELWYFQTRRLFFLT